MEELRGIYKRKEGEILKRLSEFSNLKKADEGTLFYELCFCILAVQTSGIRSWKVAERLKESGFYNNGALPTKFLREGYIRFHNNKARHLLEARQKFPEIMKKVKEIKDEAELRDWLVNNVKGLGMKEASHFLRNIGFTQNLAIIDRHILKNMLRYEIIEEIPKSLTRKKYLELEEKFQGFSKGMGMKPAELDLLLWAKEVGVVFK